MKTFREVIKDIKDNEVWEDIENDDYINISIKNNKLHIKNTSGYRLKNLAIELDKAMFKRVDIKNK